MWGRVGLRVAGIVNMVFKNKVLVGLVFGAVASLLVGCAAIPLQDVSDARQAIQAAQRAEAERHAPEVFDRARVLLGESERMVRTGQYEVARELARRAKGLAVEARVLALSAKAKAR
jgi:hypothetical protein